MNLLVSFYEDAVPARTEELVECLRRNIANPQIDDISVLLEDSLSPADVRARFAPFGDSKVRLLAHNRRVTFADLFEYANRNFRGHGVIIANADIFFDETLALLEEEPLAGMMLCLSRWDEAADGTLRHLDRPDSQDAWIFEPPLPKIDANFFLGKPGCDNRLTFEAEKAGLILFNPSRSVRARHLHNSGVRRYVAQERVTGPVRLVPSSFLENGVGLAVLPRPPIEDFPSHRGRRADDLLRSRCREIEALIAPYFGGCPPRSVRRELLRSVRAHSAGPGRPVEAPLAAVSFQEWMGYTVARLECGVSTHNNHPRPLVFVPPELADLQFTQVVSGLSTPVRIEFRSRGRVFALAAPGWGGYAPAAAFLEDAGWREPIEPLRTSVGTVFEAWSLAAEAGERLVLPTQVMLAGAELIRSP